LPRGNIFVHVIRGFVTIAGMTKVDDYVVRWGRRRGKLVGYVFSDGVTRGAKPERVIVLDKFADEAAIAKAAKQALGLVS
jgi:hypothetical protein